MKYVISTIAIISVLFFSVQYAEAEMLSISGSNAEISLIVEIEEEMNIVLVNSVQGSFRIVESDIKEYQSGAFRLSNPEMLLFAHPIGDTQYNIVILTSEGVQRLIGTVYGEIEEKRENKVETSTITTTIYPKSSIGADITKYDVPTISRNYEREPRIIVYLDDVSTIMLNSEYAPNIKIENQDYQKIAADVNLKITRDGYTIKDISDSTKTGMLSPVINILDNRFTPGFCYTITVTATSGNYTSIAQDDFSVISTAKYWDSTANPITADGKCNK